jgi:hypothetical protein
MQLSNVVAIAPDSAILASTAPDEPFWLACLGGRTVRFAELAGSVPPDLRDAPGVQSSAWWGMPLMPTDRGFLRVITDPTREERRFELWDTHLNHSKSVRVQGAIGFVASDPSRRILLGMIGAPKHTIVTYRWRWTDSLASSRSTFRGHIPSPRAR